MAFTVLSTDGLSPGVRCPGVVRVEVNVLVWRAILTTLVRTGFLEAIRISIYQWKYGEANLGLVYVSITPAKWFPGDTICELLILLEVI